MLIQEISSFKSLKKWMRNRKTGVNNCLYVPAIC